MDIFIILKGKNNISIYSSVYINRFESMGRGKIENIFN